MGIFKKNETAQAAAASTAEDESRATHDETGNEIAALEREVENDPAATAAEALEHYRLTPGAKSLLDRSLDNLSQSDGAAIEDPDFRQTVKMRAALLNAAGGDLSLALACIVDACRDDAKSIASLVYSLCYNTLKQAVFYANLDYRRYLDPRGDFDLAPYVRAKVEDEALGVDGFYVDAREEQRDAPPGLDNTIDREWAYFRSVYGPEVEVTEDIFAAALTDLRIYLQLTSEAFGWDAERPMAFANIAEKDGTFTPITDAQQALDHSEVQWKAKRRERTARENARLMAAAERAKAALTAAAKR